MLVLQIPDVETWDDDLEEYGYLKGGTLKLEHSLAALSKWESLTKKPFLNNKDASYEDTILYIKCMTLNADEVPDTIYGAIDVTHYQKINEYIADTHTATTIHYNTPQKKGKKVVTSEVIYSWLVELQIPFSEVEYWNLNRLFTLIEVVSINRQPDKKMSKSATMAQNRSLNAKRRAKLHSKG